MDKRFSFERPEDKAEHFGYKDRILSIINELERRVRVVNPDEKLNKELHERRVIDAQQEVREFEPVRRDVCEAFGVPFDDEHVFIYDQHRSRVGPVEQRALRCFYVLIDSLKREGFYGEGRTIHHVLLNKLIEKATEKDSQVTEERVLAGINSNPPSYIAFKGFLSTDDFKEITDASRKVLETPLFDKEGKLVETAENWFISGHNLEEVLPPSPEREID